MTETLNDRDYLHNDKNLLNDGDLLNNGDLLNDRDLLNDALLKSKPRANHLLDYGTMYKLPKISCMWPGTRWKLNFT